MEEYLSITGFDGKEKLVCFSSHPNYDGALVYIFTELTEDALCQKRKVACFTNYLPLIPCKTTHELNVG